ncbi:hypothetical protein G7075_12960 [Phycicoccus sp. HDW14]|uniref:hypothetical protein n=1 Tax=Phycicoccus sp. HDW14 TaxID=2714941 RepID=UPI00140BFCFD|nr:hypothetical protein [Phycicoccus sp. HDW14]QIM21823.1 hypothetical protein G7075_12960 [Phycicoccus sp. HDW14]
MPDGEDEEHRHAGERDDGAGDGEDAGDRPSRRYQGSAGVYAPGDVASVPTAGAAGRVTGAAPPCGAAPVGVGTHAAGCPADGEGAGGTGAVEGRAVAGACPGTGVGGCCSSWARIRASPLPTAYIRCIASANSRSRRTTSSRWVMRQDSRERRRGA